MTLKMEKINNSSISLIPSNNNTLLIPTNSSSQFVLNEDQFDQLSNQLKLLSINDVDINKVLKKLKTLKKEQLSPANQALIESNGLLEFVLLQTIDCGRGFVFPIGIKNNRSELIVTLKSNKYKKMDANFIQDYVRTNQAIVTNIIGYGREKNVTRNQDDEVLKITDKIITHNQQIVNVIIGQNGLHIGNGNIGGQNSLQGGNAIGGQNGLQGGNGNIGGQRGLQRGNGNNGGQNGLQGGNVEHFDLGVYLQ